MLCHKAHTNPLTLEQAKLIGREKLLCLGTRKPIVATSSAPGFVNGAPQLDCSPFIWWLTGKMKVVYPLLIKMKCDNFPL